MSRVFIFLIVFLSLLSRVKAQDLRITVRKQPLSGVINTLGLEVSYNEEALSRYMISLTETFQNPEEALYYLLKDKPFIIHKIGNVFVISPQKTDDSLPPDTGKEEDSFVSVILYDKVDHEPLPYAHIRYNKGSVASDEYGRFVFPCYGSTSLQVYYTGYEPVDTVITAGTHSLYLSPRSITLQSVDVYSNPSAMLMHVGELPGEVRINHQVARYIPGSADNSVFNLLRMLPGVRASGEPSDDLIAWGSSAGQNQLLFDGFTLFGMKSFNDQISSVNPYLVKDIRLMKGGFTSAFGNRTGAIAVVTPNEGNSEKVVVKGNVSNYTGNVLASFPIKKQSTLTVGYRQTFYNLYKEEKMDFTEENGEFPIDIYIKPNYSFRDANLRYTTKVHSSGQFYVSLYGADDCFKYKANQSGGYGINADEKNRQYAGATSYKHYWENGVSGNILLSFSSYDSQIDHVTLLKDGRNDNLIATHTNNTIDEVTLKAETSLNQFKGHSITMGGSFQQYKTTLAEDKKRLSNPSLYVSDLISFGALSLEAGLRADFPDLKKLYLQPRLSLRYRLSEEWSLTSAWGFYRQYYHRTPYQYSSGSYQMVWDIPDNRYNTAMHTIAGAAFSRNDYLVSFEGYFKGVKNGIYFLDNAVYRTNNQIWGGDLYAKKEMGEHTFFASYSLVNIQKPERETGQEMKAGAIVSLRPFYLSATYVFGTGFSYLSTGGHQHGTKDDESSHGEEEAHAHSDSDSHSYNRFDISATYRKDFRNCNIQTGISLMNLFNTKNIKYNYQLEDSENVTNIFTKATPFTPMFFFEINF